MTTLVEKYDPASDRWATRAPMSSWRIEAYDPAGSSWKDVQATPTWRTELAAATVAGTIYAVGGGGGPYGETGILEAFTPR